MRADRLLSLLMLLQSRGRMSAHALAQELEVCERTIYRDIQALSIAGVPVYGEPGPEGGYSLVENYRTSLTGLTSREVRALFMLSIPAPLAELGLSEELKSALYKLAAALPASSRRDEEGVRQRFYLDSTWWQQGGEAVPYLHTLHQAVWQDHRLRIKYRPLPTVEIDQVVDPYGLVAKAGVWHLVCASQGQMHVHRISALLDAQILEETFQRPLKYNLASFWQTWCAEQEQRHSLYPVKMRISPTILRWLPYYLGEGIRDLLAQADPPDARGWTTLEYSFESLEAARQHLLAMGGSVEVLSPLALRLSIADYGEQIRNLYKTTE